jgi:hypothetical protein
VNNPPLSCLVGGTDARRGLSVLLTFTFGDGHEGNWSV